MGCMRAGPASAVQKGTQIFDYIWRFTQRENRGNGKPPARARFCIAGNRDWHKDSNVPTSPVTPQRAIRTLIAAAVILGFTLRTEIFLRAYLQSDKLPELMYVGIPPEAGDPFSFVWAFFRVIYGNDDAGRHFHFSVQKRFLPIPSVTLRAAFETIYIWASHGAIASYVDEDLSMGHDLYDDANRTVMALYKTHRPDHGTFQLAGISATTDDQGVHCCAGPYAVSLMFITEPERMTDYLPHPRVLNSLAAKLLWVGHCGRPDVLSNATQLVNLTNPTGSDARHANDTIALLNNRPLSLRLPKLDRSSSRIVVYADYSGSSHSNVDKRQVGYLVALKYYTSRFALLSWASHKPGRVCRGSIAGELLALADGYAAALGIWRLLQDLLDHRVHIETYTDSATAYDLVTSFKDPADLQGKNDLFTLRRALQDGSPAAIHHIHGEHNPADPLSKPTWARPKPNNALMWPCTRAFWTPPRRRRPPPTPTATS